MSIRTHGHWWIHCRPDFDHSTPGHRQVDGLTVFWWRNIRADTFNPLERVPAPRKNSNRPVGRIRISSTSQDGPPELGSASRPVGIHINLHSNTGRNRQIISRQRNQLQVRLTSVNNRLSQDRSSPASIGVIDVFERRMHLSFVSSSMVCGVHLHKCECLIEQVVTRPRCRVGPSSIGFRLLSPGSLRGARWVVHVHSLFFGGICAFHPTSDHAVQHAWSRNRPHWDAA